MITRTLTTLDIFDEIVLTNFRDKTPVTIIGFSDKYTEVLDKQDLILYLGTSDNAHNWCKYILNNLKTWLISKRINAYESEDRLMVSNVLLAEYEQFVEPNYSKNLIIIKIPNGLNLYGITGNEVYELVNKAADIYKLKMFSKEGDS